MIKLVMKPKGSGKTKGIIDSANAALEKSNGDIVFITINNNYMYDIDRGIRLISANDFGINNYQLFCGFICGIISGNYDISDIFIDNIMKIVNIPLEEFDKFISMIEMAAEKFNTNITITVSGNEEECPESLKPYLHSFN